MPPKLFKIPMLPGDFSLWIEQPLKSCRAQHLYSFAASGLKDGRILTLDITLPLNPEKPSYISFHAYPREDVEGGEASEEKEAPKRADTVFIYRQAESEDDALGLFRALFLEGEEPGGAPWRRRDQTLIDAELSAVTATMIDPENFSRDDFESEKALAALLAHDLSSFEALASAGLAACDLVPESEAEDAKDIPLLARYFKEAKDLSFALEAVRAYARHGYWLRSDADEGIKVLGALSKRCGDPQFLPVWKALLDTDRPFAHPDWEQEEWRNNLCQAMSGATCDLECEGLFDATEPLYCAQEISDRLLQGLPYQGIALLAPVVGRKLSRVLIAPAPDKGEPPELYAARDMHGAEVLGLKGWAVLDFEGVLAVMPDCEAVFTDPQALDLVSGPIDVSEHFREAIGRRAVHHRLAQDEEFYDEGSCYLHQRHTITFENGACVETGGAETDSFLHCFKPDWGEFRVAKDGSLEQSLKAEGLRIWDAFHTDPLQLDDDWLPDFALNNKAFGAYLDEAWKEWWLASHKGKRVKDWRVIHEKHNDRRGEDMLAALCREYLYQDLPTEGPGREGLPADFATDRGVAVRVLRDLPEIFAKELGLLRPASDFHDHEKGCEEGARLTKSIDEANAVAKEHGWRISFEPDPTSLRETLVSDMSDPDFTPSQQH